MNGIGEVRPEQDTDEQSTLLLETPRASTRLALIFTNHFETCEVSQTRHGLSAVHNGCLLPKTFIRSSENRGAREARSSALFATQGVAASVVGAFVD